VITAAKLRTHTVKDLAAMAKRKGILGWHAMRKEQLVRALVRRAKTAGKRNNSAGKENKSGKGDSGKAACPTLSPHAQRRLKKIKAKLAQAKNLAHESAVEGNGHAKDRLVAMVRGPYWLHAYWELTRQSIERAQAAMGQYWHGARPVLRVLQVSRNGTTNSTRGAVRDIEIHGDVDNWYIDVQDPPKSYQLEIGYLALNGKFHALARSNVVSTPRPGSAESAGDGNWTAVADDFDRIYAMSGGYAAEAGRSELRDVFEERLHRPMGSPMVTRFGLGAGGVGRERDDLAFQIDAELIVYGATDPNAHVTLKGEPIRLEDDGTFSMRFALPNRRQVLPVVASSGDGVEQRTIVLAVERNTKVMEPVIREPDE